MLVRAKTRDIAIMRTMGATRRSLLKIFVTTGTTVGAIGDNGGAGAGRDRAVLPRNRSSISSPLPPGRKSGIPKCGSCPPCTSRTDPWEVAGIVTLALVMASLPRSIPPSRRPIHDPGSGAAL